MQVFGMRIEPDTCGRSGKWAYWLKCQDYTVGLRKAETSKWDKAKASEVKNWAQGSSGSPPLVGGFLLISVACS